VVCDQTTAVALANLYTESVEVLRIRQNVSLELFGVTGCMLAESKDVRVFKEEKDVGN